MSLTSGIGGNEHATRLLDGEQCHTHCPTQRRSERRELLHALNCPETARSRPRLRMESWTERDESDLSSACSSELEKKSGCFLAAFFGSYKTQVLCLHPRTKEGEKHVESTIAFDT